MTVPNEGRPHLVVVGLMSAGKSPIGRQVAEGLRLPYIDNDEELERSQGLTAGEFQEKHGQKALHAEELTIARRCLANVHPAVISVAALVIDTEEGRHLLRSRSRVAWVHADPEVLAERVENDDGHRPDGTDLETLRRQTAERSEHFESVASIVLRTDESKEAAAEELLRWAKGMGLGADG